MEQIALAAITVEHGPERYAEQAKAGNWPIWRVAVAAARAGLASPTAALVEEMAEVLRPFAEAAADLDANHRDNGDLWESGAAIALTAGSLRRAAAILARLDASEEQRG